MNLEKRVEAVVGVAAGVRSHGGASLSGPVFGFCHTEDGPCAHPSQSGRP